MLMTRLGHTPPSHRINNIIKAKAGERSSAVTFYHILRALEPTIPALEHGT